jgi:hypothetical protein
MYLVSKRQPIICVDRQSQMDREGRKNKSLKPFAGSTRLTVPRTLSLVDTAGLYERHHLTTNFRFPGLIQKGIHVEQGTSEKIKRAPNLTGYELILQAIEG